MMSTIHKSADGFIQYTKGAPDEILRRCTSISGRTARAVAHDR